MLQLNTIREEKDRVLSGLKKRNFKELHLIDNIIALDEKRRATQLSLDETLAKSNNLSKEIGNLFKAGQTDKANALKEQTATLKEDIKTLTDTLNTTVEELNNLLYRVPNIPNELVPEGTSEADNVVVFEAGEIPNLGKDALPHWELAKKYDLIDFELGVKLTGAGFPVYKGKGAKLQRALITYFLDKNTEAGYNEFQVPHVVNEASGYGTGQLPDKEGQMYHIGGDNLYLIPTAEVPVTNIFRDTLLTMSYMGTDAIVMRHSAEGAPLYATKAVDPIIINAGDGAHEHPTQALLDMYSILEKKESIEGLKVVILGDIMHSRVARSNIYGLTKMGADVHLAGPRTMVYPELEKLGVTVHHDIREAVADADVVNVLRIQLERIHSALYPTNREYARIFGINKDVLSLAKDDVMVMHPGPMNRGLEISPDVAYWDQSVIQEQVRNGVAVRMAVLYLTIIGGDGSELAY